MEKQPLTSRQKEILDYMESFTVEFGYPPTVREMCKATGLKSPRSVSQHLQALERKGYIARGRDKSRAIRFLHKQVGPQGLRPLTTLPLLGKVSAGQPALATAEQEATFSVDSQLFGGADAYLLRVHGESMVDAHIVEGDLIVVRPVTEANDGDVVVAQVGDETTVKRFKTRHGSAFLVAENNRMDPIELSSANPRVKILGRVVGLIRQDMS